MKPTGTTTYTPPQPFLLDEELAATDSENKNTLLVVAEGTSISDLQPVDIPDRKQFETLKSPVRTFEANAMFKKKMSISTSQPNMIVHPLAPAKPTNYAHTVSLSSSLKNTYKHWCAKPGKFAILI
jgi:hypothetical protein